MKSPTPHLNARTGKLLLKDHGPIGKLPLFIFEREVWVGVPDAPGSTGGSLVGVSAEVLTQGQLTQRLTATRIVALGIFALAAPKKSGNQQVLLHAAGPAFDVVFESGAIESMRMRLLNQYAQSINNQARRIGPAEAPSNPASAADELGKFAALHRDGVLTDDEFAAKKTQLLGL